MFGKKQTQKTTKKDTVTSTQPPYEFKYDYEDKKKEPKEATVLKGTIDNSQRANKKFQQESMRKVMNTEIRNRRIEGLSEKETWMLNFLKKNVRRYVSPTEVGRTYGEEVKNRKDYNSGHSRAVLLKLVSFKLAVMNEENHYKYNTIK